MWSTDAFTHKTPSLGDGVFHNRRHALRPVGTPKTLAQHASAGYAKPIHKSPGGTEKTGARDVKSPCPASRITLRQPPQNFLQSSGESQATQNQRENQLRMQPTIQKISQHAAQQHRANNRKRQLHSQRRLRRIFLHLRNLRRLRLATIRRFVHTISFPAQRVPSDYFSKSNSPARCVAFTTALISVTRSFPSSSSMMPSMVQPAGVVTESLSRAG